MTDKTDGLEVVAYWWRHINVDGEPTTYWKPCEPRNIHVNTVQDTVNELLAYRYKGKPCYEVRELCFVASAQAAVEAARLQGAAERERELREMTVLPEPFYQSANGEDLEFYDVDTTERIAAAARLQGAEDVKARLMEEGVYPKWYLDSVIAAIRLQGERSRDAILKQLEESKADIEGAESSIEEIKHAWSRAIVQRDALQAQLAACKEGADRMQQVITAVENAMHSEILNLDVEAAFDAYNAAHNIRSK